MDSATSSQLQWHSARTGLGFPDLGELWKNRSLILVLAGRDIRVRYRQTLVGIAWALLQPMAMLLVFVTFFRLLGRVPAVGNDHYEVTLLCGLLPWQYFASTTSQSAGCLVANRQLVTKVYFPRLALPIALQLTAGVDFAVALLVLAGFYLFSGIPFAVSLLALPLAIVGLVLITMAVGAWLSAANAIYRDVEHAVPFVIQIGFFVSPVFFEVGAVIPKAWQVVFALNPMVGVLEGFRLALFGHSTLAPLGFVVSAAMAMALLVSGLIYFRRVDRILADRM